MKEKKLEVMKAVYSYFFPEVRPLIAQTSALSEDLFLTSTPVESAQKIIEDLNFKDNFQLTRNTEGNVDLDAIHEPVIERITQIYASVVKGLEHFSFRYQTSGSSQGIFHILAELKAKGTNRIYTLDGEYEGYREYAKAVGLENVVVKNLQDAKNHEPGTWFISNPSAIDGNIIQNEQINDLCNLENKVILDLAYAGSTREYKFDVSHRNIPALVMSFSKPYGVFRFRMGFTYSREPIDSLYANKWFKDINRTFAALKIAQEIGPMKLHNVYHPIQLKIIDHVNRDFNLNIQPSDVFLLGNLKDHDAKNLTPFQLSLISQFKRGNGYRFCLTPYFEKNEKGELQ